MRWSIEAWKVWSLAQKSRIDSSMAGNEGLAGTASRMPKEAPLFLGYMQGSLGLGLKGTKSMLILMNPYFLEIQA